MESPTNAPFNNSGFKEDSGVCPDPFSPIILGGPNEQ